LTVCYLTLHDNQRVVYGRAIGPSHPSQDGRSGFVPLTQTEQEHASQWAAISSIAGKIGCSAETLRNWVRQAERDAGRRPGLTTG
jgi:hypothetical protein